MYLLSGCPQTTNAGVTTGRQRLPPCPSSLTTPGRDKAAPWPLSLHHSGLQGLCSVAGWQARAHPSPPYTSLLPWPSHLCFYTLGLSFLDGFSVTAHKMPLSPSVIPESHPFALPWHQAPLHRGRCLALPQVCWAPAWTVLDCISDSHHLLVGAGERKHTLSIGAAPPKASPATQLSAKGQSGCSLGQEFLLR